MANKLTVGSKFKAVVDTTSQVSVITYPESKGDKNLNVSKAGRVENVYNSLETVSYTGVIGAQTFTTVQNGTPYAQATLVINGVHLSLNTGMVYLKVTGAKGAASHLDVRVGASTIMKSLYMGESIVIPFNSALIATCLYVRANAYEEDIDELVVYMAMVGVDVGVDTLPPTPNPSSFYVDPYQYQHLPAGFDIRMVADVAIDTSLPVQYYFEETTGNNNGTDSGWQGSNVYIDSALDPTTLYTYTVKTKDNLGNVGTASSPKSVTTGLGADWTAPTPNPSTFYIIPNAISSTEITMTATTHTDVQTPPVAYYFEETSGNGNNSNWQGNTVYTDTGLSPQTLHTYRVKARDASPQQNETSYSVSYSETTDPIADTTAPSPDPMTFLTDPFISSALEVTMVADTAIDDPQGIGAPNTPIEYYFEETTGNTGGTSSSWQTSTSYTDIGLQPASNYAYRVKARDSAGTPNETAWSATKSITMPGNNFAVDFACWDIDQGDPNGLNPPLSSDPNGSFMRGYDINGYSWSWIIPLEGALDDPPATGNEDYPGSTGGVHGWILSFWFKVRNWEHDSVIYEFEDKITGFTPSMWPRETPLAMKLVNTGGVDKKLYVRILCSGSSTVGVGWSKIEVESTNLKENQWYNINLEMIRPGGGILTVCDFKIWANGVDVTGVRTNTGEPMDEQWGIMQKSVLSNSNGVVQPDSTGQYWFGGQGDNLGPFYGDGSLMMLDEISFWKINFPGATEHLEMFNNGTPMDLTQHSQAAGLTNWWRCEENPTAQVHNLDNAIAGVPYTNGWAQKLRIAGSIGEVPLMSTHIASNAMADMQYGLLSDYGVVGSGSQYSNHVSVNNATEISSASGGDLSGSMSVNLWVKILGNGYQSGPIIFNKRGPNAWQLGNPFQAPPYYNTDGGYMMKLGWYNNGHILYGVREFSGENAYRRSSGNILGFPFNDPQWVMLTMTFDYYGTVHGTRELDLWMNGAPFSSANTYNAGLGSPVDDTANKLCFGNMEDPWSPNKISEFDGHMDEISIWKKALSQAEIIDLYNNHSPLNCTGMADLTWYTRCRNGAGNVIDETGNGNHGGLYNYPGMNFDDDHAYGSP